MTEHTTLVETRIDGATVYDGAFFTMKRDRVRLPDGKTSVREYIEHPGAVMIVPLLDSHRVLMERQYRYPLGKVMLEFPAGKLDAGEGAMACAQRELREETGYCAHEWAYLTRIHPVISYSTEFIDIYLARSLTEGQSTPDSGEFIETFIVDITQLFDWVKNGQISDVKTIIGAFWLEKVLSGQWKAPAPVSP